MIDSGAPLFIVQPQPDGTLLIQRVDVERVQVTQHGELHRGSGLFLERPRLALTGWLVGGGLYTPEQAARGFGGASARELEEGLGPT